MLFHTLNAQGKIFSILDGASADHDQGAVLFVRSPCMIMYGHKSSIFVSIPSYRDIECPLTVEDLFRKAEHPSRVVVGICHQYKPGTDDRCLLTGLPPGTHRPWAAHQVRQVFLLHSEAKGPTYARHLVQQLFCDEELYLQIDSHMRFTARWDSILIDMLNSAHQFSKQPILTTYPPDFPSSDDPTADEKCPTTVLCAKEINPNDKLLRIKGRALQTRPAHVVPQYFWAAGFSFSSGSVVRDVPYSQHTPYLFFGEEQLMAARLWTHGYDFFAPVFPCVFHKWSREYRPTFQELMTDSVSEAREDTIRRVRETLSGDEDSLRHAAMGAKRTLKQYYDHIGVDHGEALITDDKALRSGLNESMFELDQFALLMQLMQGHLK